MMSDDFYIREVDEYSEETHSEDVYNKKNLLKTAETGEVSKPRIFDENGWNMQKRVNELINSRFVPGIESAEKMFLKIQEITEIVI